MRVFSRENMYLQKEWLWMLGVGGFFLLSISLILLVTASKPSQAYLDAIEDHNRKLTTFFSQQTFLHAVLEEQRKLGSLTLTEIEDRDGVWRVAQEEGALAKAVLASSLSQQLKAFTSSKPEYSEIFVTDSQGVVIGMTNITTDYFQADEEWWTITFADEGGFSWVGEVEFDESAGVWGLPLYNPIYDFEGNLVGITKALIDTQLLY